MTNWDSYNRFQRRARVRIRMKLSVFWCRSRTERQLMQVRGLTRVTRKSADLAGDVSDWMVTERRRGWSRRQLGDCMSERGARIAQLPVKRDLLPLTRAVPILSSLA